MAKKHFVYSTLTSDQIYVNYHKNVNGVAQPKESVHINGGANVMTKALLTPRGAVTEINDEELAALRSNEVFKLHEQNGFITVSEQKHDVEAVATDLQGRDQSAPLVEQDNLVPEPSAGRRKRNAGQ